MELDVRVVIGGPLDVNTYVVGPIDGDCCLIIDPGAEISAVAKAVNSRKVEAVLLTHAHFDHMLYAQYWLDHGAKLYVHTADAAALKDYSLNLSQFVGKKLMLQDADNLLEDGVLVQEAGIELKVLHTPGHTPGGVCYLTGNMLFSGDTLFYKSYGRLDFPGGSIQDMIASIRKLMKLDENTDVYPGHGMKTKIAWERRNFR